MVTEPRCALSDAGARSRAGCNESVTSKPPLTAILPSMAPGTELAPVDDIAAKIHTVRGVRVMLDSDLAALYGVTTKRLNEQLRRNRARFPADFVFQLTSEELARLRSQIGDGLGNSVDAGAIAGDLRS